jgi:WG containing repeat
MNDYLWPVQDDYRRWGFISATGIVIPPQFNDACWFSEGLAEVKVGDKWGFINSVGEMVIPTQFDCTEKFSEGLASVRVGHQWGAIDPTGNLVIPLQFDLLCMFSEGLAIAYTGGTVRKKWNDEQLEIHKMQLAYVYPNEAEEAAKEYEKDVNQLVIDGGKWGVVDKTGTFVISPRFKSDGQADIEERSMSGRGFKNGILAFYGPNLVYEGTGLTPPPEEEEIEPVIIDVDTIQSLWDKGDRKWRKAYIASLTPQEKAGKFGFINYAGDIIIEPMWDKVSNEWECGLLGVFNTRDEEDNIDEAYLKPSGEIAFVNNSFSFRPFYDGMAVAWGNDGLNGYLDTNGCLVIDYQFADAQDFSYGLAAVTYGQDFETALYGYINKSGQMVISEQFVSASGFDSNGLAAVEILGGKYGLINRKGQLVLPPKYDYLSAMTDSHNDDILYKFREGEERTYGVINSQGNIIIEPIYRRVGFGDGIIEGELEGTRYYEPKTYFNKAGEVIFQSTPAEPD